MCKANLMIGFFVVNKYIDFETLYLVLKNIIGDK